MGTKLHSVPQRGMALRSREVAGLLLEESAYAPGLRMPAHTHQLAAFGFVLRGAYTENYGWQTRDCEPSTIVFHPPAETHAVAFHQTPTRILRVGLNPQLAAEVRQYSQMLDRPSDFRGGPLAWLALRLYKEFRQPDSFSSLAIQGLALEIIATASRCTEKLAKRRPPRRVERAREILHEQFAETLSLSRIAEMVGAHPVYLARAFRKCYGCAMGEYVRRLRIEAACREISCSAAPLSEIAATLGFYDQSHFSNTFKRCTGMTPAEFRALQRAG